MLFINASKGYVDVTKDTYENGADISPCNCWEFSIHRHFYDDKAQLVAALKEDTGLGLKEDDLSFYDGMIRFSTVVDNDNSTPSEAQFERWKEGKETLYIADGTVSGCYYLPDHPVEMTDEQAKDFGLRIE